MNLAHHALAIATPSATDDVGARVTDLYERRGRELWGLARRLGASEEQAADVVQEAHFRLWRELTAGKPVGDIDGWIFRVAYRLVMDQHRLRRRLLDLVGRINAAAPVAIAHTVDDALSIWPLVDRLPARERATLYLRYRADMTFEQVGDVMGITPASARTYASRATERLRAVLADERDDDD